MKSKKVLNYETIDKLIKRYKKLIKLVREDLKD